MQHSNQGLNIKQNIDQNSNQACNQSFDTHATPNNGNGQDVCDKDITNRKKLYISRTVKVVVFVLIFCLINFVLKMGLEVNEGYSEQMLTDYSQQESMDSVMLGSSVGSMIDYKLFDELTGMNMYNMCSPSQTYPVSLEALKIASSQHKIKTVIFFTGYDPLEPARNIVDIRSFERASNASHSIVKTQINGMMTCLEDATDPKDIGTTQSMKDLFPWIDNSVGFGKDMAENYSRRFTRVLNGGHLGDGYAYDLDKVVYETNPGTRTQEDDALFAADLEVLHGLPLAEGNIDDESLKKLDNLIIYCRDNSIDLYVFVSPHQSSYKDRYEDHYEHMDTFLNDFVTKRGYSYYNFENDPEIHEILPDEYFEDWEHVLPEHYDISTKLLADYFK